MSGGPVAGHRLLPHTADVVLEAWGPTREDCLVEAVRGLVASFADTAGLAASGSVPFTLGPAGDEELLVRLLEEVIYLVDVEGVVPTGANVEAAADGGLSGRFEVASLAPDMVVGPAPKAVAWHELSLVHQHGAWRCRVTIDV